MRIVFRGQVFEAELTELAQRLDLDLRIARDEAELFAALPEADALWITPTCYTPAVPRFITDTPGRLRWIGLTSAGYDMLLRNGVPPKVATTYAIGVHSPAVAEHAVALLLALARQLPLTLSAQAQGAWNAAATIPKLRSLEDFTVAIVGFGSIGGALASRLRPLVKEIIGVNQSGRPDERADEMYPSTELHAALARSDAVVITVAYDERTKHLIAGPALAAMRQDAFLVNVSRGPVVDTRALRDALAAGRLGGAALDVADPEPLPSDDPLWHMPGVIVTPHVAAFGNKTAGERLARHFERNVARFERGEPLEGAVTLATL